MKNNIYKMLVDQGKTQAQLARDVGVQREYMNRIINDKITPTIPLGIKIAKALGSSVEDVFIE